MNQFKQARIGKGLTIKDLARIAKLSPATISNIETGKTPGSMRINVILAKALELDQESIMATWSAATRGNKSKPKVYDNAINRSELTMRCELCGRMIDSVKGLRLLPAEDNPELLFAVCLKDGCYLPISYIDPDDNQEAHHGAENGL